MEARRLLREAQAIGITLTSARTARVYLLEGPITPMDLEKIESELFLEPVLEELGEQPADAVIEVHPLPGVMDPVAQSVEKAIHAMTGLAVRVQTGHRYELAGITQEQAHTLAERLLANTVVHHIHDATQAAERHAPVVHAVEVVQAEALNRLVRVPTAVRRQILRHAARHEGVHGALRLDVHND
mgnify:CR=1 FL=1